MAMEDEEEEAEGGQEEKCSNKPHSGLSRYKDWMLSLRRPGCSRLWMRCVSARFPGRGKVCEEPVAGCWGRTPGGSFTVSGMTGLRRCRGCLKEELEV